MPTLGKDLASLRASKNLSLHDIHNHTRVPVSTLAAIEDDSIFYAPEVNQTYVRSFIRSYAKALKLDENLIVAALDAQETGNYDGQLLDPEKGFKKRTFELDDDSHPEKSAEDSAPHSGTPIPKPAQAPPPQREEINWVDMTKSFAVEKVPSRMWIFLLAFIGIIAISVGIFVYSDQLFGDADTSGNSIENLNDSFSDTPERIPSANSDSQNLGQSRIDQESAEELSLNEQTSPDNPPLNFGETLILTVYAANNKLEPVRVATDYNWRINPYWIDHRAAYKYNFKDSVTVRGQYDRMILMVNDRVISEPRVRYFNPDFNAILLTRQALLGDAAFRASIPNVLPVNIGAPDSVLYPPSF